MEIGTRNAAVQRLVQQHFQGVYRFAYRLSGSAADAEDLTQQTFLTACQKLEQLRLAERARAWLFTILRNEFLKRQRGPAMRFVDLDVHAETFEPQEFPDEFDEERLQQALDELPEPYRTPLLLFYFEELSYKEISDVLRTPVGTVMSRLSRAKQFLRERLANEPQPLSASAVCRRL